MEFTERSKIFIEALDIDDVIAHLMVGEGFATISDIAEATIDELLSIEGFDEDIANELSDRANNFVKAEAQRVLVGQHFNCGSQEVLFVSANGWDAAGATGYGFETAWVNRNNIPLDRLPHRPKHRLNTLHSLPKLAQS